LDVRRTLSPCDAAPNPGECCGRGIRELGLPKVLSETACRGDDRQTFGNWDGGRSTKHDRTYGQGLDAGKDAAWPGVECSD